VLLVDDHPVVREGLSALLSATVDLTVCGEAGDIAEALTLIRKTRPDVVIVDITLGRDTGFALIEKLRAEYPTLRMLVLSMHDDLVMAGRALRAGAHGYVMKDQGASVLPVAIRQVLAGQVYVSAEVAQRALRSLAHGRPADQTSGIGTLSERELQVFHLIGGGQGSRQIAEQLKIGIKTVEAHKARIKEKLSLGTPTELVARAARWVAYEQRVSEK
jgi:DNA-binding NarL/FixJ family response regulator